MTIFGNAKKNYVIHLESDLNSGIKGSHGNNEAANLLITIELDRRLASLERNKRIIDKVLSESCEDTITIIQELHFKNGLDSLCKD